MKKPWNHLRNGWSCGAFASGQRSDRKDGAKKKSGKRYRL